MFSLKCVNDVGELRKKGFFRRIFKEVGGGFVYIA